MDVDFDKAVSKAHLEASGWGLNEFRAYSPFECHFIYVHDVDHQKIRLLSMRQDDFAKAQVPTDLHVGALAHKISSYFRDSFIAGVQIEADPLFLPVMMAYIKQTRAYAAWREQPRNRLHFFMNIYNLSHGVESAYVRPFIGGSNEIIMNAAEVVKFSEHVLEADRKNHPEWFK